MTKRQTTRLFTKHEKMLHKLAYQCARRCGREEPEVFQQACLIFMRATSSYNPARAGFGTYLWMMVHNCLIEWAKRNDLPPENGEVPEVTHDLNPRRTLELKEWLEELSEECREVAKIILSGPSEVLDLTGQTLCPKAVRGALVRHLRSEGWHWSKVWRTMRKMKTAVSEL